MTPQSKFFAPGKYLGGGVQMAAGVGAYVVGRYMMPAEAGTHRTNKVAHIGFDLVRAQILTQSMTYAIKLDGPARPAHRGMLLVPVGTCFRDVCDGGRARTALRTSRRVADDSHRQLRGGVAPARQSPLRERRRLWRRARDCDRLDRGRPPRQVELRVHTGAPQGRHGIDARVAEVRVLESAGLLLDPVHPVEHDHDR